MVDLQKASLTTNGQQVTLTMPISKVDVEKRIVSGFATLDNIDRQGDRVTAEASQKAFENFNLAVSFNAKFVEAYNNLGSLMMDRLNFNDAINYFTKAIEINNKYIDALRNRALVYTFIKKSISCNNRVTFYQFGRLYPHAFQFWLYKWKAKNPETQW